MKYYQQNKPQSSTAYVTFSNNNAMELSHGKSPELYGPRGVQSLPCVGDKVLLLHVNGGQRYLGTAYSPQGLSEGEVRLQSSGGAVIHLKQDGSIYLNGLTIRKDGVILPPT